MIHEHHLDGSTEQICSFALVGNNPHRHRLQQWRQRRHVSAPCGTQLSKNMGAKCLTNGALRPFSVSGST
eukprot:6472650-Amphidinium_carterae.1